MNNTWLPGWTLHPLELKETPYSAYPEQCSQLIEIGKEISNLGGMPSLKGLPVNAIHEAGTSGNLAIIIPGHPDLVLMTRRGADKSRLEKDDFVIAGKVKWGSKILQYQGVNNLTQPSTDGLLMIRAFLKNLFNVSVWIHFHFAVNTIYKANVEYPPVDESNWVEFDKLMRNGIKVLNLIDHDTLRKGGKNGKPDSCIVLGSDPEETLKRAIKLIEERK